MQIAVATTFMLLCVSAPWLSRKWGWRGEIAWGIAALAFILFALLLLD